jgi:hypothetical protein
VVIGTKVGGVVGVGETVGVGEIDAWVQESVTVVPPPETNVIVVAPGSAQVGPSAVTVSVANGKNILALGICCAAAGDCPVSATIVASKLAEIIPVTRRRFPLNIALRIDKSLTIVSVIVTEKFQGSRPAVSIQWDLDESWVNLAERQGFSRQNSTYDG